MMSGDWLRAPRRLRLAFVFVMLLLTVAVGGLGWRLLDQDMAAALQTLAEQRDSAADLAAAALEKRITRTEQDLDRVFSMPEADRPRSEGAVFVRFVADSVETWPPSGLIFYPEVPPHAENGGTPFTVADELEFRKNDSVGSIAAARPLAASENPQVRAEALIRIARNYAEADSGAGRGELKTPMLREVARTAPYMHAGSVSKLENVLECYDRGGNRNPHLDAEVRPLHLTAAEKRSLVAFLRCLNGRSS
jgi:hypothetical protein